MAEFASHGVANAGLTTGIIGTALGVLNGGLGLFNGNGIINNTNNSYITKDELHYVQEIARKDSEIALLKSEQNTEVKIADVYERLITRINADARNQADWNAEQMVNNARISSAIAANRESISDLERVCGQITKTVIPKDVVCPEYMTRYNSWTAPTE